MNPQIGDLISLRDYTGFSDWKKHLNENATIVNIASEGYMPYELKWSDGSTSRASKSDLKELLIKEEIIYSED
jgi:hypothetical protein